MTGERWDHLDSFFFFGKQFSAYNNKDDEACERQKQWLIIKGNMRQYMWTTQLLELADTVTGISKHSLWNNYDKFIKQNF